ncbi:SAM-dependent methyltransferase [Modestobacter caceresii]|uniref:SAM-dependent methyltransferase n=1 Tax=Modestobacter caceresii TaxID=1522368 RepID=A0A098Y7D0_9ACTN|nr:class I SAM-dependent methyltransferase [Modestobacter caceresii]KGH46337.1 SAM-dependent methyltransferase [Modestobacter caceresii]
MSEQAVRREGGDPAGHDFDEAYWEEHWQGRAAGPEAVHSIPPNPHLAREVGVLVPGTALDAGCGAGAEALWLAAHGWQVTAADISAAALARAADRAASSGVAQRVRWLQADLSSWAPDTQFDLVTTSYAHPAMPQLEFYDRIAGWVAPGGTLLVVGHLHAHAAQEEGHQPPADASVTAAVVTARLGDAEWDVVTAEELQRTLNAPDGRTRSLRDVVVRATRRA